MSISDSIKRVVAGRDPVWKGPEVEGITFSLLSRFIVDRERFRILTIEGLKPKERFDPSMEYGNFWHICEEHLQTDWRTPLHEYVNRLCDKFPHERTDIDHWYRLALIQFPIYCKFYEAFDSGYVRKRLLREHVFACPYKLPSGRTVIIRGKYDGLDAYRVHETPKTDPGQVWLYEHKSKSRIDEEKIDHQLRFDLQTMLYLTTVDEFMSRLDDNTVKAALTHKRDKGERHFYPVAGVMYNVVRRSAHKSAASFQDKLLEDKKNGRLKEWFLRSSVTVTRRDMDRFKEQCLVPLLENVCDWYEHVTGASGRRSPFDCRAANRDWFVHWRHPNGVYNPMDRGQETEYDHYLETGSIAGLHRVETLFPELQ